MYESGWADLGVAREAGRKYHVLCFMSKYRTKIVECD